MPIPKFRKIAEIRKAMVPAATAVNVDDLPEHLNSLDLQRRQVEAFEKANLIATTEARNKAVKEAIAISELVNEVHTGFFKVVGIFSIPKEEKAVW